ncbi:hypothetical protein P4123_06785 [Pseudomonas aeruginosa]|nr:hypothetical protein [Pseudomonas aeruginosa]
MLLMHQRWPALSGGAGCSAGSAPGLLAVVRQPSERQRMAAAGLGAATREWRLLDAYADESKVVVNWQLDLEDWHVRLGTRLGQAPGAGAVQLP